jgi:hypothetical protein
MQNSSEEIILVRFTYKEEIEMTGNIQIGFREERGGRY